MAGEYVAEVGEEQAKTYDSETVSFRDAEERLDFSIWRRKRMAPGFAEADFEAWLATGECLKKAKI